MLAFLLIQVGILHGRQGNNSDLTVDFIQQCDVMYETVIIVTSALANLLVK